MKQKKLLLIDGSSYLYRAFHASPDLRTKNGFPTGAIHVMQKMIDKTVSDHSPDYAACIFDAKGKTFRHEIYSDYKANRSSMPDDLVVQIEPIKKIIENSGMSVISVIGVEADDVIGTYAKLSKNLNLNCIISTGDKDLSQLVDDNICLVNTMSNELLDIEGVKNKFGVNPDQIIDYLLLIGDKSDNIPGVNKVGPKTALKLLDEYEDFDNLVKDLPNLKKESLKNNLKEFLPKAEIYKSLLKIKTDVTVEKKIDSLALKNINIDELEKLFIEFELKKALEALSEGNTINNFSQLQKADKTNYNLVLNKSELFKIIEKIKSTGFFCFDTETTGLNPMSAELVGLSIGFESETYYIPFQHTDFDKNLDLEDTLNLLKDCFESDAVKKTGQNLKYDCHILLNYGLKVLGIIDDSLLQSYIINSTQKHNLDSLAAKYLNIETVKYDEITGKGSKKISFADVDIKTAKDYSCEDADVTYKLTHHLNKILKKENDLDYVYRKIELPLIQVLIDTERAGVLIDTSFLKKISSEFENNLHEIEKNIFEISNTNFNINSTKQLRALLFDKLNLPVLKKTPSGVPSTDEDVLTQLSLNYPIGKFLLEHRTLSKLKNTYIDKLPLMVNDTTKRVHTNYSQAVTSTGRLASNDPNLQNIPIKTKQGRLIRQAFRPEKGYSIISADYSQIELRIMAHLSEDKNLIKAFVDDKDVHTETASQIFNLQSDSVNNEQRRFAKTINFGLIYGMSAFGLAKQLNIENITAKNFIDKYFIKYPGINNFMNQIKLKAKDDKYVSTISGRRLYLPNINHSKALVRKAAERTAINAPMQGSAADIIKIAMIEVHDFLIENRLKSRLIMQVHDELVIETENQELNLVKNKIKKIMESVLNLRIPLKVDIGTGKNWDEAH